MEQAMERVMSAEAESRRVLVQAAELGATDGAGGKPHKKLFEVLLAADVGSGPGPGPELVYQAYCQGFAKASPDPILAREELGARVRAARQAKGLSRGKLASLIQVSETTVKNVELGTHQVSLAVAKKLLEALALPAEAFFVATSSPGADELEPVRSQRDQVVCVLLQHVKGMSVADAVSAADAVIEVMEARHV